MATKTAAKRAAWSAPTPTDIAHRRAVGRGAYNSVRKLNADHRAVEMFRRLVDLEFVRGSNALIAREFGVSAATVSRAMARLPRPPSQICCPLCGAVQLGETVHLTR